MKRTDLVFASLLVPLDYLALVLAGWAAYQLRFVGISGLLPTAEIIPFGAFMRTVLVVAAGWLGILAMAGVYTVPARRITAELGRIFLGASTAVLLIIVSIFFQREFFASRFIILVSWILAVLFLWIAHLLVRGIQRTLSSRGIGVRRMVVVGNDATTASLLEAFHSHPGLGRRALRHIAGVSAETMVELEDLMKQRAVDEVVQSDVTIPRSQTIILIELCHEYNVPFSYAADSFDSQAAQVEMDYLAGLPVMAIKRTPLDGWGRILKRTVDVIGTMIGIILLTIPGVIVAILIKLDSAGPVFMRLERVGEGQRRFRLWKFRSMIRDAEVMKAQLMEQNERGDGPLFKISRDPRITRIGRWLRKTSIDEIPQLLNVFRGEMSLVGPRPHEPAEVARYDKRHKKLLAIKPGITGMAQISGRSSLPWEEEVRLDTYYIEHWSLGLDLQILLRTPAAVLNAKDAA